MSRIGKIAVLIGGLLVAGIAAATIYTLSQSKPSVPNFSYSSSGTAGWYESQNGNLQALAKNLGGEYQGEEPIDKLPVADLTVHHGEKGADKTPTDECFTAFSYFDYPLGGLSAAYDDYENRKTKEGELKTLEPIDETIATSEGDKKYELRRYSFNIEGQNLLSGYQIGFIELESGHIRVEGVCKTSDDLTLTQPILQAVTFNKS